jgi:hypothetical protein
MNMFNFRMKLQADFYKEILIISSFPSHPSRQDWPVHQGIGNGRGQTGMIDASVFTSMNSAPVLITLMKLLPGPATPGERMF